MNSQHSKTSDLTPPQTTPSSEKGGCGSIGCWTLVAIIVIGLYGCYHRRESARTEIREQEARQLRASSERVKILADRYGVAMDKLERIKGATFKTDYKSPVHEKPIDAAMVVTGVPSSSLIPTLEELNSDLKETTELEKYFETKDEAERKRDRELAMNNGRSPSDSTGFSNELEVLTECRLIIMGKARNLATPHSGDRTPP